MDLFGDEVWSVSMMNTNPQHTDAIIRTETSATLLGASRVSPQDVDEILTIAPFLVAADGGVKSALENGHKPEVVIGDFDSLPHFATERLTSDRFLHVTEQDSTDFEKCLSRLEAPLILALGFTGGRLDHELAVYNALVRYPTRACIVIGGHDIVFHAPRRLKLNLASAARISLFPMAAVTGRSQGLKWPIDGLEFAPDARVGTSNAATGRVDLEFDGDGMLVIMPRGALAAAMAALTLG